MTISHSQLSRLKKISVLMDSKFTGPMGFRFGLDGLLGLIPVLGDLIGMAVSFYIIYQSAMLGASPSILIRMGLNILIENIIEMIPLLGNVFDFIWKANNKNIILLETHLLNPRRAVFQSRLILSLLAFTLVGIFVGSIAVTFFVIKKILTYL